MNENGKKYTKIIEKKGKRETTKKKEDKNENKHKKTVLPTHRAHHTLNSTKCTMHTTFSMLHIA